MTTETARIEFATKDPVTARRYLGTEQMGYLTAETKGFILDGVKRGICRVRDPFMYGGASGVVPETRDRDVWDPFIARVQELHDRDFASRPQPVTFLPNDMPIGYGGEWGEQLESHIAWWGESSTWEHQARESGVGFMRFVGPAIPLTVEGATE